MSDRPIPPCDPIDPREQLARIDRAIMPWTVAAGAGFIKLIGG